MNIKRIYITEFRKEWDKAYDNWYGKFRLRAKEPMREYNSGYGIVCFDPRELFWCHIWNGEHCVFGAMELIPGVTIVSGTNSSPMFFTPKQVVENFVFDDADPFTSRYVPAHSPYWNALHDIKEKIKANALIYPQTDALYKE